MGGIGWPQRRLGFGFGLGLRSGLHHVRVGPRITPWHLWLYAILAGHVAGLNGARGSGVDNVNGSEEERD